jgi:heptosyltransferase-1
MDGILFVKTSSLGDVVHHMPAVTDARRAFPGVALHWVVEESFAPLARLHPAIDTVIPVATRRWRSKLLSPAMWREIGAFRASVRANRYGKIVDTQGLLRSALIVAAARGEKHGYDAASIREPLASRFYDVTHSVSRTAHAVARNRMLSALSLGYAADGPIDYGLPKSVGAQGARTAVLLHGTSRESKQWSEPDWITLGRRLAAHGLEIILPWGSPDEETRSQRLAAAIAGARVPPRAPLDQVAAMIAKASLVVGVDTGLLHLAAAYRVPLVAIFVASEPSLTGPVGAGPITVLGAMGSAPDAAQVIAAAEALL